MSRNGALSRQISALRQWARAGMSAELRLGAAAAGATCAAMLFALAGLWADPAPQGPILTTAQAPKSLLESLRPRAPDAARKAPEALIAPAGADRPEKTAAGDPIAWGLPRQPMTVRARAAILDQPDTAAAVAIGNVRPGQRLRIVGAVTTAAGQDFVVVRLNDGALGYAPAQVAVALSAYRGELAAARRAAEEVASAPSIEESAAPAPVEF
jgi:hypothetical protein